MTQFLKQCSRCRKQKWNTEFHFNSKLPDKINSWCKECDSKRRQKYHQKCYQNNSKYFKINNLKLKFGLTLNDYELMLKSQNGVCKICRRPEISKHHNGNIKQLSVDHDHKTNKVRGLLCANCNHMLGNARDNPETLKQAIKYLEKNQ